MANKLKLIAGPCVIESEELALQVAHAVQEITQKLNIEYYFKSSFDKANRTSANAFRGLGLEKGLDILGKVKRETGLPIVTDIHEPSQAVRVADVCDVIQIPAFLCRQTDLLVAAAKTKRTILIKKAQFLAPWDMKYPAEKVKEAGNENIWLCERGTTFGYNSLVVDMTGIVELKTYGYPVFFDATHSVQKPGGLAGATGGNRENVEPLAKAALAVGADILFMEVHPEPDQAMSDGPNMVRLSDLENMLKRILAVYNATRSINE